jgi:uncharacterized protein YndB with AHSA1/START domain
VFDAWVDPKTAGRWLFATEKGQMVRVQIDARVGGSFLFVDRRNGEEFDHVGKYLEISRPHRLAFTFSVPKFSKEETKVTIDLRKTGDGCELTLTHEGLIPEHKGRAQEGWGMILGALEKSLSAV